MEQLLLTPEEAGRALGVGRTSVYELIRQGRLPSITIGRSRRVPVESLRTFIEREQVAQGPEESLHDPGLTHERR